MILYYLLVALYGSRIIVDLENMKEQPYQSELLLELYSCCWEPSELDLYLRYSHKTPAGVSLIPQELLLLTS